MVVRIITLSLFLMVPLAICSCDTRYIDTNTLSDASQNDTGDTSYVESEIVKYIRINASDTKTSGVFPWVREAEDSVFTIRDDVSETCYKAPDDKEVDITLDIYTTYGRDLRISSIAISHKAESDVSFGLSLYRRTCDGERILETKWNGRERLSLNQETGCIVIHIPKTNGLELCSISLMAIDPPEILNYPVPLNDPEKSFEYSGVIEGFYGVRWSNTERERMFAIMNRFGLRMYVYAPKNEPKHRGLWREEYTREEFDNLLMLSERAREYYVDFFYAISPFVDFDYNNPEDFQILLDKLKKFVKSGVYNIGIFADDIEIDGDLRVDAALGKRHRDVVNAIYDELKTLDNRLKMLFVGTVYSDERIDNFEDGEGYLREIAGLRDDIQILWTGKKTSGATLTSGDVERFYNITHRRPVIWDNFWANDGGDGLFSNLYLSDYTGRESSLLDAARGIGINPLIQGSLTRPNAIRFGMWMNGVSTKSERGWSYLESELFGYKVKDEYNSAVSDALLLLSQIFNGNSNKSIEYEELNEAIDRLEYALEKNENIPGEIDSMSRLFAQMYILQSLLYNSNIDSELFDEIYYPADRVRYDGLAGIYAIQYLLKKLNGELDNSLLKKVDYALNRSESSRFVYSPQRIQKFVEYLKNTDLSGDYGIDILKVRENIPKTINAASEYRFTPFEKEPDIEVYGLIPQFYRIEKGSVVLNIPYAGNYTVVIKGKTKTAFNITQGSISVK